MNGDLNLHATKIVRYIKCFVYYNVKSVNNYQAVLIENRVVVFTLYSTDSWMTFEHNTVPAEYFTNALKRIKWAKPL